MLTRSVVLIALLLGSSVFADGECEFAWEQGPDLPSPRDYLGCGVVDGLFVVAGGAYWKDEVKHYGRETIAYSPSTKKWIRLPYLPEPGAYGASAVLHDQLLIAGGANEKGATSACFRLAKAKGAFRWERLHNLPRPLAGASGAVIGSRFYVFGGAPGMDEAGIRAARPSLLVLDLSSPTASNATPEVQPSQAVKTTATSTRSRSSPARDSSVRRDTLRPCSREFIRLGIKMRSPSDLAERKRPEWKENNLRGAPAARIGAAVAASGGRLYVFGGYGVQPDGAVGNFGDGYVLDLRRGEWKRLADMPLASRWTSALDLGSGRIGLFGGYANDFLDRVLVYDIAQDRYVDCTALPQAAAVMAHGIAGDGTVFLAGGEDAPRRRMPCFFVGRLRNLRP